MSDAYDLAMHLCGITEDDGGSEIDDAIYDRYDIGMDQFAQIAQDLLKLVDVGQSPLTGKTYKGFSDGRMWLMEAEVNND